MKKLKRGKRRTNFRKVGEPTPFDYSTVPGFERPHENTNLGNISEIRQHKCFRDFLSFAHATYGSLASFFYGNHQIIVVGSYSLWEELSGYAKEIAETRVTERCELVGLNGKTTGGHYFNRIGHCWKNSDQETISEAQISEIRTKVKRGQVETEKIKNAVKCIVFGRFLDPDFFCELDNPDNVMQFLELYFNFNREMEVAVLAKSDFVDLSNLKSWVELNDYCSSHFYIGDFKHLPPSDKLTLISNAMISALVVLSLIGSRKQFRLIPHDQIKIMIFDVLTKKIELDNWFVSFNENEIDIFGHPIPAKTPILISAQNIFNQLDMSDEKLSIRELSKIAFGTFDEEEATIIVNDIIDCLCLLS